MGKILATASVIAAAFGVLLLSYAPATCACLDPVQALALHAGLHAGQDINPVSLETGLNRTLAGQDVVFGKYPYTSEEGCSKNGPNDPIVCRIPIDNSVLLSREYRVAYHSRDGLFQKATVVLVRWP